jgi:osmotically inducible protein OsmC
MPTRQAEATWEGDLKAGKGSIKGSSGAINVSYSFGTRFGDTPGTNPEELLGAAHAGCYSMALAHTLASGGHVPKSVHTTAAVTIDAVPGGFKITKIKLTCEASVPGLDNAKFQETATAVKSGCPVSGALAAVPIELVAKLV